MKNFKPGNPSRRKFLGRSLVLAGTGFLSPAMLSSCIFGNREEELEIDYIGNGSGFASFEEYFKRIRHSRLGISTLERSLGNRSHAVILDTVSKTKPAYILMLLEQGKDILTCYPLGFELVDYARISEFMESSSRVVGLINPLVFYPSMRKLRDMFARENISPGHILVNCHPTELGGGFRVSDVAGTGQLLQRIVSRITGSYPISVKASADPDGSLRLIRIRFPEFDQDIRFDPEGTGWNMRLEGEDFTALADHTGLLALNGQVEPAVEPDPDIMETAIRDNLEDFLQAVRRRKEPRVNHLDGLASIMLNQAVTKSMQTGKPVKL